MTSHTLLVVLLYLPLALVFISSTLKAILTIVGLFLILWVVYDAIMNPPED